MLILLNSLNDLLSHFPLLQDYRQMGKVEHKLSDILLLVID